MPTRLIREGILDSDRVNSLSWGAEVFYRRLMSIADDHGLADGRIPLLRGRLYALKLDQAQESDVSEWLSECVSAGLVVAYKAEGKELLQIRNFGQKCRTKPRYPLPEDGQNRTENNCQQMPTDAGNLPADAGRLQTNASRCGQSADICKQMPANVHLGGGGGGGVCEDEDVCESGVVARARERASAREETMDFREEENQDSSRPPPDGDALSDRIAKCNPAWRRAWSYEEQSSIALNRQFWISLGEEDWALLRAWFSIREREGEQLYRVQKLSRFLADPGSELDKARAMRDRDRRRMDAAMAPKRKRQERPAEEPADEPIDPTPPEEAKKALGALRRGIMGGFR